MSVLPADTFGVEVTPSDGTLTGTQFTSGTVTATSSSPVVIEEPVVNSITISPDNPSAATDLSAAATGANPEGGTLSYTYQWLQDGTPIAGATASTLDLTTLTIAPGDTFAVEATPFDGTIYGAVVTSSYQTVASINPIVFAEQPTVTNVALTPDSTSAATHVDGNAHRRRSARTADHLRLPVAPTTAPTSPAQPADPVFSTVSGLAVGDELSVVVTPTDSESSTGAAFTSSAITVATISPTTFNLPTVTAVAIAPDNASDATTLTATPTSTDPLGQTVTSPTSGCRTAHRSAALPHRACRWAASRSMPTTRSRSR